MFSRISSLVCLMTIFYVHDEAEFTDVVLRNKVADTIFIFLPKIVTVLLKTSLADEKLGETLKSVSTLIYYIENYSTYCV